MWIARAAAPQAHGVQHLRHPLRRVGLAAQAEAHVVAHGQVRKQRVVLEHHADAALLGWQLLLAAGHQRAVQPDLTRGQRLKAGNGAQHRGLAAA